MTKRGRPWKVGEKCTVEDVLQAMADLDFERRAREFVEKGNGKGGKGKLEAFLHGEPGSRSGKWQD